MSSLLERHPEQDLLLYIDGELSPRRAGKVSAIWNPAAVPRGTGRIARYFGGLRQLPEGRGGANAGSAGTVARPVPRFFTN
jgi:hypothetical protein